MQIYLPIAEISVNLYLLIALGGGVGVVSGLFGVGGGFLITPLLILIGIPPAVAVATGANQVAGASFSGVLVHWRRRTVDVKMGLVLMTGGLAGSAVGVQVFAYLRELGQVDLVVSLSYVVMLGTIGALMLVEGLQALRRSKTGAVQRRRRHGWVHGLPFTMRFRAPDLSPRAPPPLPSRPVGGVRTRTPPGLAAAWVAMWSGGIRPVPARPYLISASRTLWPPTITAPAAATRSAPPRKISLSTSVGSSSSGKPTMLSAVTALPPIA